MKNRRIAIVAFLIVAILLMGVGYAAISRNLQITGSAHISAVTVNEFDVTFSQVVSETPTDVNGASGTAAPSSSTNTIEAGAHEVTLSVAGFETVGDKLVLVYEVEYSTQKEGIDALLETPVVTIANTNPSSDTNQYFTATATFATDTLTEVDPTTTLTLEIELVAVPTDATFTSITVTFSATPKSNA